MQADKSRMRRNVLLLFAGVFLIGVATAAAGFPLLAQAQSLAVVRLWIFRGLLCLWLLLSFLAGVYVFLAFRASPTAQPPGSGAEDDRQQADAVLACLAQTINSTLDLDRVLSLALTHLKQVIPYNSAAIMLLDSRDNLTVAAASGFPDEVPVVGSVFTPGDKRNIGYQVIAEQKVRVEEDVQELEAWGRDDDTIEGLNVIHGWIGAPLVFKGQTLGLLTIDNVRPHFYTEMHGNLAAAFADQLAIAVQNARSYQVAQERAKEMGLLYDISQHISAVLDWDALLSEIMARVRDAFGHQLISIYLLDEDTGTLDYVAHLGDIDDSPPDFNAYAGRKGIIPWVAENKQTLVIPDVSTDDRYVAVSPLIRSELAIPLLSGNDLLGVFNLESSEQDAFDEWDVQLMEALAHQITVALINARLFESVRHQASELEGMANYLAEEKSKLDAILRNIADGLIVADPDRKVVMVNPAFEYMFACSSERIVGEPLGRLSAQPELLRLVRSAQEEPMATFSAEIPMPDSRTLKALAATAQDDGRILGTVTVVRDITHEKAVERMKTEFISAVSHELRTPLTSVLGFAKLIVKTFANEVVPKLQDVTPRTQTAVKRIHDNLDIIVVEAERLTRLINDVLDLSKMESGELEWRDRTFSFLDVLRRTVESERSAIEKKGLSLEMQLADEDFSLEADLNRMRQLIHNLLTNAIKFTHKGRVTVAVRKLLPGEFVRGWRTPLEGKGGILCTVSDTGIGITPENMPRLFQRFQQVVADALTDRPTGAGLGLVICREIVSHYGGVIWAESSPGVGSIFSFTLPLVPALPVDRSSAPVMLEERPHVSGKLAATLPREAPVVLVVDDDPHIRELLVQELIAAGYRVLEAANGVEAIAAARSNLPSLIVLDVMMPDISGFDVTRILKSDVATAAIPVLILSIMSDREQGLALGADDYLIKPVESAALLAAVSKLLTLSSEETQVGHFAERAVIDTLTATLRQQGFRMSSVHDPRGLVSAQGIALEEPDTLEAMIARLGDAQSVMGVCYQAPGQTCSIVVLLGEGTQLPA